ncbi:Crp/Fnr family transcriptional regulator [Flavobacterium qiangtangense]|uniref:Crp/Fnr family transcriptional regulator n=1 Tax=Flavobacterium qiangtangense TaxID=1442595 RepID=A0ABW1PPI0_9FLAO
MEEQIVKYRDHIKEICPEITESELQSFTDGLTVTHINKNGFYINAGEIQKRGGFLTKGLIRAFYTDKFGNEKNIYFVPENEYAFHYASFIDGKASPLSFQCLEKSTIINFSGDHLRKAFEQIPRFERYGRLLVESKLKIQQERLESLLYKDAEQLYVDFITNYSQLFNRISLSQLCSYLGVERQTLTRIRKKISQTK